MQINSVRARQADSGDAQNRALSWTDVPLFAPALAVLASAAIAVSALAVFTPPKNQTAEVSVHLESPASEHAIAAAAQRAVRPVRTERLSQVDDEDIADDSDNRGGFSAVTLANMLLLAKVDGNLPSAAAEAFVQQKAAEENVNLKGFRHGIARPVTQATLELPVEQAAKQAAVKIPVPNPAGKPVLDGQIGSVAALDAHFERIDYDLATVRDSGDNVPRLYLDKLPADIADVPSVTTRKRIFIKSVLPVVLRVNEDILAARQRLQELRAILDSGLSLTDAQRDWLHQMAERYETAPYDWDAFMERVDIVPPSLAIAQAAEESGWGTSRFAREGNALFGQYTYKASHGMLPEQRASGQHHLVRAYSNLVEGTRSYVHNLNYHRAYGEFRAARKWLRSHAKPMDGLTLAGELIRYSERGAAYVETIRRIIRVNELAPLDDAQLHDERWTLGVPALPGRQS
ncbi:MAG: glucosaminidase domain-containing protein [Proteobacteria bacterium]|nr:glucosaminidase domain-containing protein [Pseudomonadota bacterium]MDA1355695.1 glucosaminidase domain-containing protein [Pseudomonadota bacterium]